MAVIKRAAKVEGFGDRYWITEDGEVLVTLMQLMRGPYARVSLKAKGSKGYGKQPTVHRLVALGFIPNPENKPQVNHIDGNKMNNKVSNLEWATASENALHAYRSGLRAAPSGVKHVNAKFSVRQVREIRRRVSNGESRQKIADEFDVAEDAIQRMTGNGKIRSYKDVL